MRKIVEESESSLDYLSVYTTLRNSVLARNGGRMSLQETFASTAAKSSFDAGASLIVVLTNSGATVRMVAKYRPKATILAVTSSEATARSLNTLRGVISTVISLDKGVDAVCAEALAYAKRVGVDGCVAGGQAVLVNEEREGVQ